LIKQVKEYKYDGIKQNISRRLTRLIKELPDNSVDLVITSPPHILQYIDDEGISADDYVDWFIPYCIEIERVIKPTGSFILYK
jgi:DNA modification methylase